MTSTFDFATPVERRHPADGDWPSQKWHRFGDDVLPLWVADMDFRSPPAVTEALRARVDHGVYGYGLVPDSLREALCEWSAEHYGWPIEPDWQLWLPGVVPALHMASLALTEPGDGVLTVTPIYPPFLQVRGVLAASPSRPPCVRPRRLTVTGGSISRPWNRPSRHAPGCCCGAIPTTRPGAHGASPSWRGWLPGRASRPAGRLRRAALRPAARRWRPAPPAGGDVPSLAERTLTLWAPSKTFNLAGLTTACAVIPDAGLRRRYADLAKGSSPMAMCWGWWPPRPLIVTASLAPGPARDAALPSPSSGGACRDLAGRQDGSTAVDLPGLAGPEECPGAARCDSPQRVLLERAGVALSDGADFGWPGFVRLNFGTTAEQLEAALARWMCC